jgi:hypothetical protein
MLQPQVTQGFRRTRNEGKPIGEGGGQNRRAAIRCPLLNNGPIQGLSFHICEHRGYAGSAQLYQARFKPSSDSPFITPN